MEDNTEPVISLSEWLKEAMRKYPEFRDLIMNGASELDKSVYDLHEFEKKD